MADPMKLPLTANLKTVFQSAAVRNQCLSSRSLSSASILSAASAQENPKAMMILSTRFSFFLVFLGWRAAIRRPFSNRLRNRVTKSFPTTNTQGQSDTMNAYQARPSCLPCLFTFRSRLTEKKGQEKESRPTKKTRAFANREYRNGDGHLLPQNQRHFLYLDHESPMPLLQA